MGRNLEVKKIHIFFFAFIVVIVVFSLNQYRNPLDICEQGGEIVKETCWQEILEKEVEKKGVKEAFDLLSNLYETDPDFAGSCHDYAHVIGESAFKFHNQKAEKIFSENNALCGYGFYHGYIIAMVAKEGDYGTISSFCNLANDQLSGVSPGTYLDCYHGIGHGVTDYGFEGIETLEKGQLLINNSLGWCERVSDEDSALARCADGVYHAITEVGIASLPQFIDTKNPLSFCAAQEVKFQKTCYGALGFLVMQINMDNFEKALLYSKLIANPDYSKSYIRQLSGYQGYRGVEKSDHSYEIKTCRKTQGELVDECLKGLLEGITDFSKPGEEHLKGLDLCLESELNENEKELCIAHALEYFEGYFGSERKEDACKYLDKQGEVGCI